MRGVNKVIIVGRVGKDPESRFMPSGSCVVNTSLATSEKWKDKQTGQPVEKTEWHNIVAFGKTAEIIAQYVKKGDPLYIEGKLTTEKWQDKQTGADRYTTKIIVNQIELLGSSGGQQQAPQQQNGWTGGQSAIPPHPNQFAQQQPMQQPMQQPQQQFSNQPQPQMQQSMQPGQAQPMATQQDDSAFDSDIPF